MSVKSKKNDLELRSRGYIPTSNAILLFFFCISFLAIGCSSETIGGFGGTLACCGLFWALARFSDKIILTNDIIKIHCRIIGDSFPIDESFNITTISSITLAGIKGTMCLIVASKSMSHKNHLFDLSHFSKDDIKVLLDFLCQEKFILTPSSGLDIHLVPFTNQPRSMVEIQPKQTTERCKVSISETLIRNIEIDNSSSSGNPTSGKKY